MNLSVMFFHWRRSLVLVALLLMVVLPSSAQVTSTETVEVDGFRFRYGLEHPELPPLSNVMNAEVRLARAQGVWTAPRAGGGETVALTAIPSGSRFSADGLRAVAAAVVAWFNDRGFDGVWVMYANLEVNENGLVDFRPEAQRPAELVVWVGQVAAIRTLARGHRFRAEQSINHPSHRRILAGSPLQPAPAAGAPGDLFRQDRVEQYLRELSAFPGKRVEASIAAADAPGQLVLDYLVTETKPWMVYAQASNTGASATNRWRGRIGYQHNQLTDRDDVLTLDAIGTPDLDSYGAFFSYRLPLLRPSRLAARVYGSYGDFLASDTSLQRLRFGGKNVLAGVELIHRALIWRGWELTTSAGAMFTRYQIESEFDNIRLNKDSADFVTPYVSSNLWREGDGWVFGGGLRIDRAIASGDTGGVTFGRVGADTDWMGLRWNVGGLVYLDRIFDRESVIHNSAHELSARLRGRMLLDGRRLIPQEQEPIGGALTVRGYPEAVLSADEFVVGTIEYAFHVPRALPAGDRGTLLGRPFSWRPEQPGQRADWDLILRGFFDYGHRAVEGSLQPSSTVPTRRSLQDRDVSLAGAGAGVELTLWRNFSLRCDVGVVLKGLRDEALPPGQQTVVERGDVRAHVLSSVSW
jgi:hemolysin activation/secretion protein